jgi:hypothetical protein
MSAGEPVRASGETKGRHMARALLGYVGNSNEQVLLLEVSRLRKRVAELESELDAMRDSRRADLDLELHEIAEVSAPVLT